MTQIHSFANVDVKRDHDWVTVVNPTNRRMLLQACDKCGVVKSENTVVQQCRRPDGEHLITGSLARDLRYIA
jgi:hypothetical protein